MLNAALMNNKLDRSTAV